MKKRERLGAEELKRKWWLSPAGGISPSFQRRPVGFQRAPGLDANERWQK